MDLSTISWNSGSNSFPELITTKNENKIKQNQKSAQRSNVKHSLYVILACLYLL